MKYIVIYDKITQPLQIEADDFMEAKKKAQKIYLKKLRKKLWTRNFWDVWIFELSEDGDPNDT